jgi:replicative DNA helicase
MKQRITVPSAPEIEAAVLGSIILEDKCLDTLIELITSPEVFFVKSHQMIYATMLRMYKGGMPIDTITLHNELKKEEKVEVCGGQTYLSRLSQNVPSTANIEYHAKILIEKWLLRAMIDVADIITKKSYGGIEDAFNIHSTSLIELESIMEKLDIVKERTLWEDFQETINDIEERYSGVTNSGLMCKTFPSLNKFTGGIRETDFIGILGDYKQGKSFLAQQIALDFAIFDLLPIGIFSLEMDKKSLYHRAYSLRTGIAYSKLRNPKDAGLTEEEFKIFIHIAEKIFKNTKIYVVDRVLDKNRIKAKMKLLKQKHGVKLFVVDYLNLVELNEKKERRELEISALSRFFKNMATELEVPIIVLSQVNDKGISAESKGLMRDADFLISVKKPLEAGINEALVNGVMFKFNQNHFLVALENSRHGRNGFSFVAGFIDNNLVEIDVSNSHPKESFKRFYETEEEFKR